MKKFFLLIAVIAVIAACSKHEVLDKNPSDTLNGDQNLKDYFSLTVDLWAGQNILVGSVEFVKTDDEYFEATYTLTGGWTMSESHLYAGDQDPEFMPVNKPGAPKIGKFPYKETHDPAVTTYTYSIPTADLSKHPMESGFAIAAHCVVDNPDASEETAWAEGNVPFSDKSGWSTYINNFYAASEEMIILYGIQETTEGNLILVHINVTAGVSDVIYTENISVSGTVDAAAYDQLTGNFFFVIGNTLYVNNLNNDAGSLIVGTLTGIANGGTFLNGYYYYLDANPASANYNEIIQVALTYDPDTGGWSLIENPNYSVAMPAAYDLNITDLAVHNGTMYLIGVNSQGTIYMLAYDGTAWSNLLATDLTYAAQITTGIDGELYVIEAGGELSIIDPESGISYPPIGDPPEELGDIIDLM
ncbi:MAG: hypothetical protein K8R63_01160 [Bacteroidales bacterium]|nr:hypothetical protein [Bacteroidales bacterium]